MKFPIYLFAILLFLCAETTLSSTDDDEPSASTMELLEALFPPREKKVKRDNYYYENKDQPFDEPAQSQADRIFYEMQREPEKPVSQPVTPEHTTEKRIFETTIPTKIAEPILPEPPALETKEIEIISQAEGETVLPPAPTTAKKPQTILINFNNVNVIELLRFISRISDTNFVFDENDLQFNVTIVSEEATTVENIMAALLQELRIHDLDILEQGNNLVIHRNPGVNGIAKVVSDNIPPDPNAPDTKIETRVFRLNTADPDKVAAILRPLVSVKAIIEVFKETNNIIVTDLVTNIEQIAQFLKSIDSPNNGLVIAQYVVKNGFIDNLIVLAESIMRPISQDQTLIFVPHPTVNSIFIVSTPFLIERTLAILQYLDQTQGLTRIFNLKDLTFSPESAQGAAGAGAAAQGQWELDPNGNWVFRPGAQPGVSTGNRPPEGYWFVDEQGNWRFQTGAPPPGGTKGVKGPEGQWVLSPQGYWIFQLEKGKAISPERLVRPTKAAELPIGNIERTQFYIYKLLYRKGDQVQNALARIGDSLRATGISNADLVDTIYSVQWIDSSNSLIFTGTAAALDKVRELVKEIDAPLRQVFLEMLILETDIDDSLNFGVDWGTRFGGGNVSGSQLFFAAGSPLNLALNTTGVGRAPDASVSNQIAGFTQGIVGQHLTHCGLRFSSIGTLISAIHSRRNTDIVLAPKLLTEDNSPAEIFVGINTAFPTQSIVNNNGNILTQNFEFRDVGTRFRVTPFIGNNDVVTLIIEEEVSSLATNINTGVTQGGPTTNLSRSTMRVHLPNEFFLIISGMMQDNDNIQKDRIPCIGGIPILGAAFSNQRHQDTRRNLMVFIRPKIIDTEEDIDNITKHEQDIFNHGKRKKDSWKYEEDDALDFFNLPKCDDVCEDECAYTGCEECE